MRIRLSLIVASLALVLAPVGLAAQQPGGFDPGQLPPEARELITELQQIQAELVPIQQQALQDPELQAAQQALGARIQQAMLEADPSTPQRMERLQALVGQAQAAQAAEDQARMTEIVAEAQQIEQHLQAAQAAAFQRPEIQPQLEGFQTQLREKMLEVDPESAALIERAQELDARLAVVLGQGQ